MAQETHKLDLREIRRERAMTQPQLGGTWTVVQVEAGRRLPGPSTLRRWAARLSLPSQVVMAACRESQRRALVARARSARVVVGQGHRGRSCQRSNRTGVRKAGR